MFAPLLQVLKRSPIFTFTLQWPYLSGLKVHSTASVRVCSSATSSEKISNIYFHITVAVPIGKLLKKVNGL